MFFRTSSVVFILVIFAEICHGYGPFVYLKGHGTLQGELDMSSCLTPTFSFLGIRYGMAERFEKPVPDNSTWKTRKNSQEKLVCPQPDLSEAGPDTVASEDCLRLNVWTPKVFEKPKIPVIVFFHGGIYVFGSNYQDEFNGAVLASKTQSVVVTVNYRLGSLGFLATHNGVNNLGLYDQLLALEWVQKHIHSFGGDPTRVTISGNSAGSMSVGEMLLSPQIRNRELFKRALMMSGAPNSAFGSSSLEVGVQKSQGLAQVLGCDPTGDYVACLKNLPFKQIVQAQTSLSSAKFIFFGPVYGSTVELIPEAPHELIRKLESTSNRADLLFGTTMNEGSTLYSFFPQLQGPLNMAAANQMVGLMIQMFGLKMTPDVILEEYKDELSNNSDSTQLANLMVSIYADLQINCPVLYFAKNYNDKQLENQYTFGYFLQQATKVEYNNCKREWGVCHTSELPYIFGLPLRKNAQRVKEDQTLSFDFIKAVKRFVYYGNVEKISKTSWTQAFENHDFSVMSLKAGKYEMLSHPKADRCTRFWHPVLFP